VASKSTDRVDRFLAAPDTVRSNEGERQKYEARKAQEAAEKARLSAMKSKKVPSDEDLFNDIIRVASDEVTNPQWFEFKAISRRRYELYGHYPVAFLDERFGTFEHAKQIAGLSDKPGTRQKKFARAEQSRREHAMRYAERYLLPYVVKEPEIERALVKSELMLSLSDLHSLFLDPFTFEVFKSCCRDLMPDVIVLNGDVLEGSEISRYPKIPGWTVPLQLEFDFAREVFRQLREAAPHARIIWSAGNHGLDRMVSYLTQVAPALANLRCLRFDQLAGLDDLNIELAQGGSIMSPAGTEEEKPGRMFHGFYYVYHGVKLGATPALAELNSVGFSGQSGHVHRASVVYGTTMARAGLTWMSTPMACTNKAGRSYMKGPTDGWQKGFGVAHLNPGGTVNHYPVITDGDVVIVEGHAYRRKTTALPDPTRNWLV